MASCSCELCKGACEEVPGWFSPEEAVEAIDAGFSSRLSSVLERFSGVTAIAPSTVGYEGKWSYHKRGRCTFLKADGLCEIHESGFKPVECRTGFGCKQSEDYPSAEQMRSQWTSEAGIAAIDKWKATIDQ